MKKMFLILATACLLLCAACGSSSVEGTWYSVVDETMYNFADGEIKASGVVVGQYEDNGDSVVISMMNDGGNLQLYVTTMDGVDVLADVKTGGGNVYFCKGLEEAQKIIQEQEDAQMGEMEEFVNYIKENIYATWETNDDDALYDRIIFRPDGTVVLYHDPDDAELLKLVKNSDGTIKVDVELVTMHHADSEDTEEVKMTMYMSQDGTERNADDLKIYTTETTYSDNIIYMFAGDFQKVS